MTTPYRGESAPPLAGIGAMADFLRGRGGAVLAGAALAGLLLATVAAVQSLVLGTSSPSATETPRRAGFTSPFRCL